MMGIGRCKDLDEWLVGSGESAETADSSKKAAIVVQGAGNGSIGHSAVNTGSVLA